MTTVICVVLLQDSMGFVEGETGYCSETCVMCDVDRTEEVSIKVEDPLDINEEVSIKVEDNMDINNEIPEPIPVPPIKSEHEVRVWGVCQVVAADAFRPFIGPKKEIVKSNLTISGFGGLGVNMLASATQVGGFEPGRSRRIFQDEKILSMPPFGGEVNPSVPCHRFAACKRTVQMAWSSLFVSKFIGHFLPIVTPFPARGLSHRRRGGT
jgi:hypothetical protein